MIRIVVSIDRISDIKNLNDLWISLIQIMDITFDLWISIIRLLSYPQFEVCISLGPFMDITNLNYGDQ